MQKAIKYTIFKTRWGYFGLAGTKFALLRTRLPDQERENLKAKLLKNLPPTQYEKALFETAQEQITAYFDGDYVNFSRDFPIILDGFSFFISSVLAACRDIRFGQTTSYSGLAKKSGRPGTARAVGGALAKNPLPLIIPCHRVIRSNGKIGGFSTPGGTNLKAKLLELEQQVIRNRKSD